MASADSASDLVYSVHINTPSNYSSYNCYGYAIGVYANVNPGYYSNNTWSPSRTKQNVLADLAALGYNAREVSGPNATLNSNEVMLAFHAGTWTSDAIAPNGDHFEVQTYHIWVKNGITSPWTHKYSGESGIMRFKYVPQSSNVNKVTDEYYNAILNKYSPPTISPSSGTWGYIAFDFYGNNVSNRLLQELEASTTIDKVDNSAGAYSMMLHDLLKNNND